MAAAALKAMEKGRVNDFYRGKVLQASYFADVTLPHTAATLGTCLREGREIIDMPEKGF